MVLKVTIWGHPHWCREMWNSWNRCAEQDSAMKIATPHCWRQLLDYQECLKGYKDRARKLRADQLWEEYLKRKYLGILPSQQYGGPNPKTFKNIWHGPTYEGYEHMYPNRNKGKFSDKW